MIKDLVKWFAIGMCLCFNAYLVNLPEAQSQTFPGRLDGMWAEVAPGLDAMDTMEALQRDARAVRSRTTGAYFMMRDRRITDARHMLGSAINLADDLRHHYATRLARFEDFVRDNTSSSLGWDARYYGDTLLIEVSRMRIKAGELMEIQDNIDWNDADAWDAALDFWAEVEAE